MASLTAIRAALKETFKANISNLNVYSEVSDVTQVPAIVVMPSRPAVGGLVCDFNGAFGRGLDTWHLELFILVARTEATLAQKALDQFVTGGGPKSIRRIIYENPTLGLSDGTDAHAEGVSAYDGSFDTAGVSHVGAVVRLTVRTSST
ncbi:hypothetical protein ACIP79_00420 [Streptomyces sp. NPDC088747]|uniref:hypothetical protein n=1 Tax=Streptomyces sp. NPDC088747 TaxID=3365886 RepID=UPI0038006F99